MKRKVAGIVCTSIMFMGVGCSSSPDMVSIKAIDPPLTEVLDRHDQLLEASDRSNLEKEIGLRSTNILRGVRDAALGIDEVEQPE